jgi:hypothetical protein
VRLVLGLVLMVPALQLFTSLVMGITASLVPAWMENYETLMETAGFTGDLSLLLILYAVVFGPISEELCFRGVIFSSARKVFPFWAANMFQALLFGIFHLNMMQGIYAFFVGLVLGWVCGRGGSIYLSILLHMLFNCFGTFSSALNSLFSSWAQTGVLDVAFLIFGIVGIRLFVTNRTASPQT